MAGWGAAFCSNDAVLGALHTLYQQFEQQEAQRHGGDSGSLAPVDPSALREALAQLPGQQFGLGEWEERLELGRACSCQTCQLHGLHMLSLPVPLTTTPSPPSICRRDERCCRGAADDLR